VQLLAGRQLLLTGPLCGSPETFERLLSRCNDVGLLAEELDPQTGRMLGNFPQAYSHVGLINCALNLSRQAGPAEERAETQAPPTIIAASLKV
jgi:GH15 family glucan-1,4-alpha-glucosidase